MVNKRRYSKNVRRPNKTHFDRNYAPYDRAPKRKSGNSFFKILTVMVMLFVIAICSIMFFADNGNFLDEKLKNTPFLSSILSKITIRHKSNSEFTFPFGPKRRNILLLGVDSNGADSDLWVGTRTDTIILLNVDPASKTVNAISIPRDSKVYLPNGMGVQKINAAHAIGGVNMTIKTIEDTLGVHVDRYVMLHDEGVREIVKALGGVDIYIEKDMRYNDYSGKLHINFTKGKHHLSEKDAVEYLRFRHDALGDIGRTQRQQWFLRGLLADLHKPETVIRIPALISVANKYVKTNMSAYEMTQYASLASRFDMDNIEIAMLPGGPNQTGYVSYWILDPVKTQEVVDRLIYRKQLDVEKESYTASILSSKDKKEEAAKLKAELEENGIKVVCSSSISSTHSQFVAHKKYVTINYYAKLKKQVPSVKSKQFVYDPVHYMCAASDFTVVLAGDDK